MSHSFSDVAPDHRIARLRMVDTQIRPVQVNDIRIIEAMRTLPRERFVRPDQQAIAYIDQAVALGDDRFLTEPRVIARLIQSLVPLGGERALVVGAGTGYAACLLASLRVGVTALEQNQALAAQGRALLAELAPDVEYIEGELSAGWAANAPYDMILIDGAVPAIPDGFAAQLTPNGRLAGVLAVDGRVPVAFLAENQPSGLRPRAQFDCATRKLPELTPPTGFRF